MALPAEIRQFVQASTGNYGKVKLVLQRNAFFVESPFPDVLHTLLQVVSLHFLELLCHGSQPTQAFSCHIAVQHCNCKHAQLQVNSLLQIVQAKAPVLFLAPLLLHLQHHLT